MIKGSLKGIRGLPFLSFKNTLLSKIYIRVLYLYLDMVYHGAKIRIKYTSSCHTKDKGEDNK